MLGRVTGLQPVTLLCIDDAFHVSAYECISLCAQPVCNRKTVWLTMVFFQIYKYKSTF